MFNIKTTDVKTWDINTPIRHCIILKKNVESTISPDAEILYPDLVACNYNIIVKR